MAQQDHAAGCARAAERPARSCDCRPLSARRGFGVLTPERRRAIASKGGRTAHEQGRAHRWSPDEASAAGRKGGLRSSLAKRERLAAAHGATVSPSRDV